MTTLALALLLFLPGQSRPAAETLDESLGEPFIDGTLAISIQPPKEWHVTRLREPEKRGIVLLRMLAQAGANELQEILLKLADPAGAKRMGEVLKEIHHSLELEFSNVEILSQQEQTILGRPAAYVAAVYFFEGIRWLRLEAVVERNAREHVILLYTGPAEARAEAEPLFQRVLASLRFIEERLTPAELEAALDEGAKFLQGLGEDALTKAVLAEEYLKVELDGKPVGFLHIQQAETERKRVGGIRVRERGWTFEADGRACRLDGTAFVSDDLREEEWKTQLATLIPAAGSQPAGLDLAEERGLRNKHVLLTSQKPRMSEPVAENPPLSVPKSYLPRGMARLLPRLLGDLSEPRRLAFAEYDAPTRDLLVRVYEVKGQAVLPGPVTRGRVYRIDHSEGTAGALTSLYVNSEGRIQRIETGRLVFSSATPEELERLFAARVEAAKREMARIERLMEEQEGRFVPRRPASTTTRPSLNPPRTPAPARR